MGVLMRAK